MQIDAHSGYYRGWEGMDVCLCELGYVDKQTDLLVGTNNKTAAANPKSITE
jgi:hypothetical protein